MKKQNGQTMIAMMIVLVIILVMVVVFFGVNKSSPRKDKLGYTTPGLVRLSALDTKCQSDLDQVRQSIEVAHSSDPDSAFPPTLQDLKLPSELLKCPVGGEAYVYDPATGTVRCPHPGHEKY